jgi:hypothetical protein
VALGCVPCWPLGLLAALPAVAGLAALALLLEEDVARLGAAISAWRTLGVVVRTSGAAIARAGNCTLRICDKGAATSRWRTSGVTCEICGGAPLHHAFIARQIHQFAIAHGFIVLAVALEEIHLSPLCVCC